MRFQRRGRRRVSVVVAFSVALALAVLAVPAGGAGGSEARGAASGDASADTPCETALARDFIGGLADAVATAANKTGPEGLAIGVAALAVKQVAGVFLTDCGGHAPGEDKVEALVRGLSAQIEKLNRDNSEGFLQQQIRETEPKVSLILNAQKSFLEALKYELLFKNTNPKDPKWAQYRAALIEKTKNFLDFANQLIGAPLSLDRDLISPSNSIGRALIPAVRKHVGNERFFTHASSLTIHRFFEYYVWVQTQLAAVLTEHYALGGTCAKDWVHSDSHRNELLRKADCGPLADVAKTDDKNINQNIETQRKTLPPILDPRVAIDRTHKRMWLLGGGNVYTNPVEVVGFNGVLRNPPGELSGGPLKLVRTGSTEDQWRVVGTDTSPPDTNRELGVGSGPWHFPSAADYQALFAGQDVQPLTRLNHLGARYNGKPLEGNPAGYLWLADDFYVQGRFDCPHRSTHYGDCTLAAVLYKLVPGAKSPPATQRFELGNLCQGMPNPSRPGTEVTPTCGNFGNRSFRAYIFWWRPLDAAEGGRYWCHPGKEASWDPAEC